MTPKRILFFANTDWYLYNFRLSLAQKLRADGWDVVLVAPTGPYGPKLEKLGFQFIPFDFSTKSTNPLAELLFICQLVKLYRRLRPTLVHHFTIKCVLYGSFAARFSGVKGIVNAVTGLGHIFTDNGLKAVLLRPFVRLMYKFMLRGRRVSVIFQNSENREYFLENHLVSKSRTSLIRGSGVNCDTFHPSDKSENDKPEQSKQVQLLFASRLMREKGIYELLDAFARLRSSRPDVKLLLAGDIYPDNPSSLTMEELQQIKAQDGVCVLGHVDDMKPLLESADLVVLPSYAEGTPRILIEAAAMSKPIVATDIAGCRGLVEHEVSGLLVPVKDAISLANALDSLVLDAELRTSYGRAGREIVLREFDEKIVLERTFAVYRELNVSTGHSILPPSR